MKNDELVEKILLGEITGRNQAIHACDKLIWSVGTGFLTIFFLSWKIF